MTTVEWEGEGLRSDLDPKDWIFVSDAHFTGREPEPMGSFLRFLDSEKGRMSHLVIMGDLFEFFFGFKKPFVFTDYLPVLRGLQQLHRQGVRIKYYEGNHDFFLQSLFSRELGMEVDVYPEGNEERLGRRRAFVAHGDLGALDRWRHRVFRKILKNQWTYRIIQFIGPALSRRIALWLSRRSFKRYHLQAPLSPPPFSRAFARRKFLPANAGISRN